MTHTRSLLADDLKMLVDLLSGVSNAGKPTSGPADCWFSLLRWAGMVN
jgi:hypothetical protein